MANNRLRKKQIVAFHQELDDLLNRYDLLPEDRKLHLITSKMNFSAGGCLNCQPQCCMTKIVTLRNGHTTVMRFCDPDCH
jgi:hypothetical protein